MAKKTKFTKKSLIKVQSKNISSTGQKEERELTFHHPLPIKKVMKSSSFFERLKSKVTFSDLPEREKIAEELRRKEQAEEKAAEVLWSSKKAKKGKGEIDGPVNKIKVGIKGFDELFKEGIPEGSSVLLEGGPGSGKTVFGLQILYNACKKGMKCLYMTFEEPERRLRHHMNGFGWDPRIYEKKGLLRIEKFNSLDVARSVEALLSEAKRELLIDIQPVLIPRDFQPDIVVIDSLSAIGSAFTGEDARFRIYMEQLFRYLESHGITSFLVREISHPSHIGAVYTEKGEAVSFLSDGIIALYSVIYYDGRRGRALEVLKMRGEDIDRRIVEAEIINKKGFVIYPHRQLILKSAKGSYILT